MQTHTPTLSDFQREFHYFAPILETGRRIEDVIPGNMPKAIRKRIKAETKMPGVVSIVHNDSGSWGVFVRYGETAYYAFGNPDFLCDTQDEAARMAKDAEVEDCLLLTLAGTLVKGTA
jgi:hypothetical protein